MRIIKSGKKRVTHVATCQCNCSFEFEKKEAEFISDQRDGDCYVINCPECKAPVWIDASLMR